MIHVKDSVGVVMSNVVMYGSKLILEDSANLTGRGVYIESASGDAILVDGVTGSDLEFVVKNASNHGVHITDSSLNRLTGVVENAGLATDDTYDAVILDGDSDQNRLAFTVVDNFGGNQMRYGVNISASTCNTNVEASFLLGVGATGPYNDSGTDTRTTQDHIVT